MRAASALVVAVVLAFPAVVAQDVPGTSNIFPFQPMAFSAVVLAEWTGIGGPLGDGAGAIDATENQSPAPDACVDADDTAAIWGNTYVAIPTLGQKIVYQERTTLVPGNSVPAPPELIALCSAVREALFGQAPGYGYPDDPQAIGTGDVTVEADSFALISGTFDAKLRAFPPSLGALLCEMDLDSFAGTESQGDEVFAAFGFANGVLHATADNCDDVADDMLAVLVGDDPLQAGEWDPGAINEQGGATLWDLSLWETGRDFGLHVVCLKATVFDDANALAGVFEDYTWFWVDGPENTYALAPDWAPPENSDGRADNADCGSLGIPL